MLLWHIFGLRKRPLTFVYQLVIPDWNRAPFVNTINVRSPKGPFVLNSRCQKVFFFWKWVFKQDVLKTETDITELKSTSCFNFFWIFFSTSQIWIYFVSQGSSQSKRGTYSSAQLDHLPLSIFLFIFFQSTDATVEDGFAPLGTPLLPWENRMGRGHKYTQTFFDY